MEKLVIFGILSLPVVYLSWRTLFTIESHGFYRFFSWECIIWLFVSNYKYWFVDAFSIKQIFSWIFLFYSVYLIIAGVALMKKKGKPVKNRDEKELFQFEKTSELIDTGIFRYIRHPLYSSLLFLTWGIFLKNTTNLLLFVALSSSVFLYLTAIFDEKECIRFFGDQYREYMKRSKRFIPFVI
ncbi:MAG: isoprenylcysteine carboxylmethyltransferase family protein [Bacteroidia bacterium]|nr:isoprenylcysteine carboxylmethyltransferase family protein [Bacteroidia bacterium]